MPKSITSELLLGEHPMALNIFILLDCAGLVFLIYVLVNFWNEWRRYQNGSHSAVQLDEKHLGDRIAIIPAVHLYPKNQNSVIPFPARYRQIYLPPEHHTGFAKTIEMRRRELPVPRASQGRV
jgi:hypothetical protein